MTAVQIQGYGDKISVRPGDRIKFMVSVEGASSYRAEIVRLINGDENPAGPGPKEERISTDITGEYPARYQPIHAGSHIVVEDRDDLLNLGAAISVHAFIMPTTPDRGAQGIVTRWDPERRAGWALAIDGQGRLAFWVEDGSGGRVHAAAPTPLVAGVWYSAGVSYDRATGRAIRMPHPWSTPSIAYSAVSRI